MFLPHFVHQTGRQLAPLLVIQVATSRRDGEPGGNRQADAGHFGQIGPFAAQKGLLIAAAISARRAEVVAHPPASGFAV